MVVCDEAKTVALRSLFITTQRSCHQSIGYLQRSWGPLYLQWFTNDGTRQSIRWLVFLPALPYQELLPCSTTSGGEDALELLSNFTNQFLQQSPREFISLNKWQSSSVLKISTVPWNSSMNDRSSTMSRQQYAINFIGLLYWIMSPTNCACGKYKAVDGLAPRYLADLRQPLSDITSRRLLRSSTARHLLVP